MGESVIEESTQDGSGGLVGRVQDSIGSWIRSVASILDGLALTGEAPVRAADGTSLCPGSECGPTFDASDSEALILIQICVILAVAGTLAIFAGRRRSTVWKLATIERWAMRVWWETRQVRRASQWRGERRPALDGDGLRRPVDSFFADGEN